ncbi:MAG: NADH-quinone oxidoreductase subunit M [Planctomycetota bacterium]|nr:NADH-quinone oxidoreductase subunit M [Planctomycetota bacterium]
MPPLILTHLAPHALAPFALAQLIEPGSFTDSTTPSLLDAVLPSVLNWMLFLPALAGAICFLPGVSRASARALALLTTLGSFALSLVIAFDYYFNQNASGVAAVTLKPWIESIHANYHVGVDGLNLPLVLLTTSLSVLVVLAAWRIEKATQAFMGLFLFLLTGMLGVFVALDLFLFYLFFEVSLLPMYFLIGIWGGPRKEYAAIKFFLYTLAGSICLLFVMLGLYCLTPAGTANHVNTWQLVDSGEQDSLISESVRALFAGPSTGLHGPTPAGPYWLHAQAFFLLTLVAFLIKLPAVPFHTWLPDAHVEAPTPISMILAGVLLKMGGYGLMRVTYPLFPDAARHFWLPVATLGVVAILYGGFCALAQTDWKKLVAYSSVSHMGYVTLGLAVLTRTGFDGAYFQMIAHGITSALMFFLVGVVYDRAHHRDINRLGGLWLKFPGLGGWSLLAFCAGMGLPGLCGFVGELLVIFGTFEANGQLPGTIPGSAGSGGFMGAATILGLFASLGVVITAGYTLWMFQRVFMGPERPEAAGYAPITAREYGIMAALGMAAVLFGLVPLLVFRLTDPTFYALASVLGLN